MADKTRSGSDATRIKRSVSSIKTKNKQPFDLESFLSQANGGRTKLKYQKNETIFRQGDSADAVFYIIEGECRGEAVEACQVIDIGVSRRHRPSTLSKRQCLQKLC